MKFNTVLSFLLLIFIIDISYGATHIGSDNESDADIGSSQKSSEKMIYPKKVSSLKKRRTKIASSMSVTTATTKVSSTNTTTVKPTIVPKIPADVADAFKNLPADDLEFIKELDNQFKLHGDKIKIKVEHENTTDTKNSKRTIDGELGYGGYQHGYEYQRPKFMFYPYSQKDIPSDAPSYYPSYQHTSVTIEPSYSYELKPQTYQEMQQHTQPQIDLPHTPNVSEDISSGTHQVQQHQQSHYDGPVIVLRIPGPTKYASHLQTLLQQYLEIRAAQYLHILEEAEIRKHQQQHYQQPPGELQAPPITEHVQPTVYTSQPATEEGYNAEVAYAHQMAPTPPPIMYPEIDDVYQSYKGRHYEQEYHTPQHQQVADHQTDTQVFNEHATPAQEQEIPYSQPQFYYMHTPTDHAFQNVYFLAMAGQPIYTELHQHQSIYAQDEGSVHSNDAQVLPTSENSPRKTHTKVIFTPKSEQDGAEYSNAYTLPSIRPYDRHAPTSAPFYYQHYQQSQDQSHAEYQDAEAPTVDYAQPRGHHHSAAQTDGHEDNVVAITQRPFNYHAHALRAHKRNAARKRGAAASTTLAPTSAEKTDEHLKKISDYVRDKLGAQMGSTVEFKTTQLIQG